MKKKLAKLLIFALLLSALGGLAPAQAAQSTVKRIGLLYGSSAAPSVRLDNVEGSGYYLGRYDDQRQFISLAWTGERAVNVLITQNLYLDGKGGYSYSRENSVGAVGCYHVHLPPAYPDFDSALAAAQQIEGGFVAWVEGAYYVRVGSYTSKAEAEAAAAALGVEGACLGETSGYGYSVVAAGTTRILFQFDAAQAGETGALAVRPGLGGDAAVTQLDQGDKYRGDFRFERINGGASTVVNLVDLEDYVKGIIPYEMSASWPLEALKAQAVCARTYSMSSSRTHGGDHFDLCTTTHCQVYRGVGRADANSDQAVDETAGQMAYYDGKLIDALYYSSNGGASEDAKNIWGNEFAYLKGKPDPYEADIAATAGNYSWSKTYTADQLKERFRAKNYMVEDIVSLTTKLSPNGNVIELNVKDAAGKSFTVSRGEAVRTLLGLNSIRFTVTTSGGGAPQSSSGYQIAGAETPAASLDGLYALGGDGTTAPLPAQSYVITGDGVQLLEPTQSSQVSGSTSYTFTGTGWGHSVGLSQWGAYAMAKRGYSYLDILKFYYTGITVE